MKTPVALKSNRSQFGGKTLAENFGDSSHDLGLAEIRSGLEKREPGSGD